MPTILPTPPSKGGFLPDTFLQEVDHFLEDTESEEESEESDDCLCVVDDEEEQQQRQQQQQQQHHDEKDNQPDVSSNQSLLHHPKPIQQPSPWPTTHVAPSIPSLGKASNALAFAISAPKRLSTCSEPTIDTHSQQQQQQRRVSSAPIKSALKKSSSYNGLQELRDDEIPIDTKKSAWKTLPAPPKNTIKRVGSSPSLMSAAVTTSNNPNDGVPRMKRNVSFNQILVRDYNLTVGDNPSCMHGTPISLDWEYRQQEPLSLEDYEHCRSAAQRRSRQEMRLGSFHRQDLLRDAGVSRDEMQQAQSQAAKIRRQRAATLSSLHMMPLHALVESATRKVKRLGKLGKTHSNNKNIRRSRSANALLDESVAL